MQLTLLILLLFAVQWKGVVLEAIGYRKPCCLKTTDTKVQVTHVIKYLIQDTALCPIKAVRFKTTGKDTICSDPESEWAKYAMCVVDSRTVTKKPEFRCRRLKPGQTKATTITSTKPPTTTPSKPPTTPSKAPTTPSKAPTTPSKRPTTTTPSKIPTTASNLPTTPSKPSMAHTSPTTPPRTTPSKPPMTTKPVTAPSKETGSTMAMTPNATDENSATTHKTLTTKQLLTTVTELLRSTPPGATPRPTTSATAVTSATPQKESEASTFAMTSRHIKSSVRPLDPKLETSWTERPASQYTPKAVTTKPHNPTSKSSTTMAKKEKPPKIPWTIKRVKKRKKSGLRKAQKNRNG